MDRTDYLLLYIFFHLLFTAFNIFLSIKANNDTHTLKSLLLAICAPYIYFYYMYTKHNDVFNKTIQIIKSS
jgi:hypothetical protein